MSELEGEDLALGKEGCVGVSRRSSFGIRFKGKKLELWMTGLIIATYASQPLSSAQITCNGKRNTYQKKKKRKKKKEVARLTKPGRGKFGGDARGGSLL